jgi:DNA-dependent RNA polymerase auxiliary subunit epsilon
MSLDYYIDLNENQRAEIKALTQMNAFNVRFIEQLEQQNEGLNAQLTEQLRAKKKWRNATLLISGANVIFLTSFVLSR